MVRLMAGRPCEYTQEIADELCSYLSAGESLKKACSRESMPCVATIFSWMRKFPAFLNQYTRAKQEAADAFAEDMLDIADDSTDDIMFDADGNPRVNNEAIQRSRLRVDTRKWLASKLKPKKYGEKLELAGDPAAPLVTRIVRQVVDPKADANPDAPDR